MKRFMKKFFLIILILSSSKSFLSASLSNDDISELLTPDQPVESSSILDLEEKSLDQPADDDTENNRRSFFENQEKQANNYKLDETQEEKKNSNTEAEEEKKEESKTEEPKISVSTETQPNAILTSLLGGGGLGSGVSLLVAIGYLGFKSSSRGQRISDNIDNFNTRTNDVDHELSRPIQALQQSRPVHNPRRQTIIH